MLIEELGQLHGTSGSRPGRWVCAALGWHRGGAAAVAHLELEIDLAMRQTVSAHTSPRASRAGQKAEADLATPSPEDGAEALHAYAASCEERGDKREAVRCYEVAAKAGLAKAQCRFGLCFVRGMPWTNGGLKPDLKLAAQWFHKAAAQGHTLGQYNLGKCYARGYGIKQDWGTAAKLYALAAEKNFPDAQCDLGTCYHRGHGVTQNRARAIHCFRAAAQNGSTRAQYNLAVYYKEGDRSTAEMKSAEANFNPRHYGSNLEGFRALAESAAARRSSTTVREAARTGAVGEALTSPRGMPSALEPLYLASPHTARDIADAKGLVRLPPRASSPSWPSAGPQWTEPDPVASGQRLRPWEAYDGPSGAGAVGVGKLAGAALSSTARRVRVDSRLTWLDRGEPASRLSHSSFVSPRGGWTATPSALTGGLSTGSVMDRGGTDANVSSASISSTGSIANGCYETKSHATPEQWSYESIAAVPPVLSRLPKQPPRAVEYDLRDVRAGLGDLEWAQEGQMNHLYSYLQTNSAKKKQEDENTKLYARRGFS